MSVDVLDAHVHTENVLDRRRGDGLSPAGITDGSLPKQEEAVAEGQGRIQIVQRAENGDLLLFCEAPCLTEDQLAVCDVKVSRWLVKDHKPRLLGKGAGNGDLLLLPARKLANVSVGKGRKTHLPKDPLCECIVLGARPQAEV